MICEKHGKFIPSGQHCGECWNESKFISKAESKKVNPKIKPNNDITKAKKTKIPNTEKQTFELKKIAQNKFNAFIRKRDAKELCICCKKGKPEHAGHFYSAGHYNHLRFNEDNVHGCCLRCNYYLSGNLVEYRKNLEKKIGLKRLEHLDFLAKSTNSSKNNRFEYLEIIEKYK